METIIEILARELGRDQKHVENVAALLDEGNTIPFIARYRKELHGSMDDTALRALEDRLQYLRNLAKRREEVKSAIEGQGKLTEELSAAIDAAATLAEVEDLYRPYKQKRRTRATVAREKGLEPLAAPGLRLWPRCGYQRGRPGLHRPREGGGDGGGRPPGGQRHHCRAHFRRRRHPQGAARPLPPPGDAGVQGGGQGAGGHGLPPVLRLPPERKPAAGPPGSGDQPGGAGGVSEGRRGDEQG